MTVQHLFRSRGSGLIDLFLNSGEEYQFSFTNPYSAVVVLRALPASEQQANGMGTEYTYQAERPVDNRLASLLKTLASGRLPRGSIDHRTGIQQEDGSTRWFPNTAADGSFDPAKPAELQLLPQDLVELFYGRSRVDSLHALRVAQVIEWRFGWSTGRLRQKSGRAEWSIDGRTWRPWPNTLYGEGGGGSAVTLGPETREWVRIRVSQGLTEPSGHELLREADDISGESQRGSIVLAAAAFEAGVKSCVIAVAPETEWLLKRRTAPPALQLLNSYLPRLASRVPGGRIYELPKSLYALLESGISLRNRVVHDNAEVTDWRFAKRFRRLVRDSLYLMDAYAGHPWALSQIRPRTRSLLGISEGERVDAELPLD